MGITIKTEKIEIMFVGKCNETESITMDDSEIGSVDKFCHLMFLDVIAYVVGDVMG